MAGQTTMELRKFVVPEIITGVNASLLIGRYIAHFGSKKPLVVTDRIVRSQSWFNDLIIEIEKHCEAYVIFDEITPNPKDYEAALGADVFLSNHCDLVIAIGGGSPMDCAKCISIVSTNGGNIKDYEGVDRIELPGPPLICIPSTAGTSADVSQFAIICDTKNSVKKAIISKKVVPDLALIDPIPLMTMDPYLTACTGMDALTHAIEAYVSNAQSQMADIHALEAIRLISQNIEKAIQKDRNIETMYQMMMGSLQAGFAFSNASLGAVHALAHGLGGLFDLQHGECNSILLGEVIDINFSIVPERFKGIANALGISTNHYSLLDIKKNLIGYIDEIRSHLGIEAYIKLPKINDVQMDKLIDSAMSDPCMVTNPKQMTKQEVREIYGRILQVEK